MPQITTIEPYAELHACGHRIYQRIPTTQAQRDLAARKSLEDCFECTREAAREIARVAAERDSLPALDGSHKQTEWALTIRQDARQYLADQLTVMTQRATSESELRAAFAAVDGMVYGVRQASFWIDRRDRLADLLDEWLPIARVMLNGAPA